MPIRGLSEKRRFVRGGKIRLGEKKVSAKSGKEYPSKLDYFLFDPYDEKLLSELHRLYGEKPKQLPICFVSEDIEQVFPQHYKCYGSSGLLCKGDGETAGRVNQEGGIDEVECPGPNDCPFALNRGVHGKPGCKQVANLQFMLPDMPGLYVWQIDTSSYNSILNINSQLDILRSVVRRISFIECNLVLQPQEATNPDDNKKIIIYAMHLQLPVSLRQVDQIRPMINTVEQAMLPGPPQEDQAPDDLYPRSQLTGPEPEEDEVDPETGEVLEKPRPPAKKKATASRSRQKPAPTPAPEPEPSLDAVFGSKGKPPSAPEPLREPGQDDEEGHGYEDDAEVMAALEGCTLAKRNALLASAKSGNWPRAQLLKVALQGQSNGGRPTPSAYDDEKPARQKPEQRNQGALF